MAAPAGLVRHGPEDLSWDPDYRLSISGLLLSTVLNGQHGRRGFGVDVVYLAPLAQRKQSRIFTAAKATDRGV